MFKQLYALARQLVTLMQDVQKLKAEQKEFRQELRALIDIVRQLKYEQQRDRENATHEREKLFLRLENALLRFERRLPPGSSASESADRGPLE
jgi:chromosome segregation ATPase